MTILGISGFEDFNVINTSHVYFSQPNNLEDLLTFSNGRVPIQFFPLSLIGHDSAASLLIDGKLTSFVAEERLSRIKHGFNLMGRTVLPRKAIMHCLHQTDISWDQVDYFAHYCNFSESTVQTRFKKVSYNLDVQDKALLYDEYQRAFKTRLSKDIVRKQLEKFSGRTIPEDRFIQVNHHLAHAAGAYYSSEFEESLILTLDGYGENESSLWATGNKNKIEPHGSIKLPTSLGILYQVITAYLGFRSFGDEYKVMGLSSYGDSKKFKSVFDGLVQHFREGNYSTSSLSRPDLYIWLKEAFEDDHSHQGFSQKAADIAASLQSCLEVTVLEFLSYLIKKYALPNLCLAGGVALNACMNAAIIRSGLFKKVFIQPAAADDGSSLGAALYVFHDVLQNKNRMPIQHVFWGPKFDSDDIRSVLRENLRICWRKENNIEEAAARLLAEGKTLGWFQGHMEMGPRALGARSILADPRSLELRNRLNIQIKNREFFQPFAPSVLSEYASKYFDISDSVSSPYMLVTFLTLDHQKDAIPGVVHVDGTARLQTVSENDNPRFYRLLKKFYEYTDTPVLLNTSFNRAGEPIVNTPEDALHCFIQSGLDALVMEDYLILPENAND